MEVKVVGVVGVVIVVVVVVVALMVVLVFSVVVGYWWCSRDGSGRGDDSKL